jgi:multidrug efflux system outer membrane protein
MRRPFPGSTLMRAATLAGALTLAGCAFPTARENVDSAAGIVAQQSGTRFAWRRTDEDDAAMLTAIDPLLAGGLDAGKAIAVAYLASPELQIALEKLEVSRADLVAAITPPNPVAVIGVRDPGGGLAAFYPKRNVTLGVLQNVLALLNMPARRRIAQYDLERVRLETADRIIGLAAEVNQAWLELVTAQRVLQLRERAASASNAALDTIVVGVANQKDYGPLDLALERNALYGVEGQVIRARLDVATARARLAQQMGIAGLRDAWEVGAELPPLPAADPDPAALEARALSQRLDLRAARQAVLSRLKALSTQRQFRWLGSLELGLFRESVSGGTNFTGPNAVVELPLFDQRQSQLLAADAELRNARRALDSLTQTARSELRTHAAEVAATRALAEKSRDAVLPNQRQILAQQGTSVEPGSVDRLHLRLSALAAEEEALGYLRDYWRARGALARAAGDWGGLGMASVDASLSSQPSAKPGLSARP